MIRYVLGGVALVATGYGVAKFMEEECSSRSSFSDQETDDWEYPTEDFYVELDENAYEPKEDESLGKYDIAKIELYNTTLIDLSTALKEIENLPQDIHIPQRLKFAQTIYPFESISDELNTDFDKHKEILSNAKQYIDSQLDKLDTIIINKTNFEEYSDEDKKL